MKRQFLFGMSAFASMASHVACSFHCIFHRVKESAEKKDRCNLRCVYRKLTNSDRLVGRDCSTIPNIMWFEYVTSRGEAHTRNKKDRKKNQ